MEDQAMQLTRELMETTVSFVTSSINNANRRINELIDAGEIPVCQKGPTVKKKLNERLAELLEEIHQYSSVSVRRSLLQYLSSCGYKVEEDLFELADDVEIEELDKYIKILITHINDPEPAWIWEKRIKELFSSGQWLERSKNRKYSIHKMTKEDAFRLGYALSFSVDTMEAFLVRTMENDGFDFTRSADIIHFFCFSTGRTQADVKSILQSYNDFARQDARKKLTIQEKDTGHTNSVIQTLKDVVSPWGIGTEDDQNRFLEWLKDNAPTLDVPSQAAHDLFYRLAQYYVFLQEQMRARSYVNDYDQMVIDIMDIIDDNNALQWNEEEANFLGQNVVFGTHDTLKFYNTDLEDCEKEWYYLYRNPSGHIQKQVIGDRISTILTGEMQASKADLLKILFAIFEMCESQDRVRMAKDYMDFADRILKKAHMRFYLPHYLEYSMVAALALGVNLESLLDKS